MTMCLCRRHLLGSALLLAGGVTRAAAATHAVLYQSLRQSDALDPYVSDGFGEIVAALGRAMRVPAAVNRVPGEGGIMVCVLRPERQRGSLTGIDLPPSLTASPASDPTARIIWIDSDFLRTLAVRISLWAKPDWGGRGLSPTAAVAASLLNPPPALPEYWQPETSPALRHQTLALISRGLAGFLVAHEMAHVQLGTPPSLEQSFQHLPQRARQLAPMCPQLIDDSVKARHAYEDRADAIALQAVLGGGAALGQAPLGLPGEIGIATLFTLMLAADVVRVGTTVDRPLTQKMVEMQIGHDAFVRLREQTRPKPGTDLVGMFYTDTHPAAVQRLLVVMQNLSKRPDSMWYGNWSASSDQMLLAQLVEQSCAEALRSQ
jgi:hypothetical protein